MAGQGKPGAAAAASLDNHTSQQKNSTETRGGDQLSEAHPQKPTPPQPSQTVSPAEDPMFKHRNLLRTFYIQSTAFSHGDTK